MKKQYFKFDNEVNDPYDEWHDGYYYAEVIDGVTQRQIIEVNDELFWATLLDEKHEHYFFTDQPEFSEDDIKHTRENFNLVELSKDEFSDVWSKSGGPNV